MYCKQVALWHNVQVPVPVPLYKLHLHYLAILPLLVSVLATENQYKVHCLWVLHALNGCMGVSWKCELYWCMCMSCTCSVLGKHSWHIYSKCMWKHIWHIMFQTNFLLYSRMEFCTSQLMFQNFILVILWWRLYNSWNVGRLMCNSMLLL